MTSTFSVFRPKILSLFLNTSFLFLLSFYLITSIRLTPPNTTSITTISPKYQNSGDTTTTDCTALHHYSDYKSKCLYVKSHIGCQPNGYVNYLKIFYCSFGRFPLLGYALLLLWLVLLFYVLGNTASDYFCPSLESLSKTLKLSPAIAGTTLLPLGNGSNDVFASIISFTSSGDGDIGLNSVLGGAFFISSIVIGVLSILITSRRVVVDKPSFIRDVLFLVFSLFSLLAIVFIGRISFWGAVSFSSIYILYISVVCTMHFFNSKRKSVANPLADEVEEIRIPLLGCVDEEKCIVAEKVVLYDDHPKQRLDPFFNIGLFLYILELPLYLPRRLTIPVISQERWSKPFAVISIVLSPILIAIIWNTQMSYSKTSLLIYMIAAIVGLVFGTFAFMATTISRPPQKCLFPWLACGFLMSITWTYITAEELISLLVSLGNIIGMSPSILGLTVLAWGNSIGDLIANVAIALRGGPDGAQIAVSGCYAGPVFNVLVGLGLSLVFASWSQYPSPYVIPTDQYIYETIGFFMGGLLWALVILPKKGMRLDQTLGGGLMAIYLCFLFIKLARALGFLKLSGSYLLNIKDQGFSFSSVKSL